MFFFQYIYFLAVNSVNLKKLFQGILVSRPPVWYIFHERLIFNMPYGCLFLMP
jgi:hypothetical protein